MEVYTVNFHCANVFPKQGILHRAENLRQSYMDKVVMEPLKSNPSSLPNLVMLTEEERAIIYRVVQADLTLEQQLLRYADL